MGTKSFVQIEINAVFTTTSGKMQFRSGVFNHFKRVCYRMTYFLGVLPQRTTFIIQVITYKNKWSFNTFIIFFFFKTESFKKELINPIWIQNSCLRSNISHQKPLNNCTVIAWPQTKTEKSPSHEYDYTNNNQIGKHGQHICQFWQWCIIGHHYNNANQTTIKIQLILLDNYSLQTKTLKF
jgi:hypothetical protein